MKKLVFSSLVLISGTLMAQDMSYSRQGNNLYFELPNPARTPVEEWSKLAHDINVSFASDNIRYPKEKVPAVSSKELTIKAWKGEKVHTQILVWTKKTVHDVSCKAGDLSDEKGH